MPYKAKAVVLPEIECDGEKYAVTAIKSAGFKDCINLKRIELPDTIKWIGKSLNERGEISVTYTDSRANSGAVQLANYIDNNKDSYPHHVTVGYLAVFDLRRKENKNPGAVKLLRTNADYYKEREIKFVTKYETIRTDFKKPYRFFIKVSNNAYQD